jgi:acylphosphatase
MSEPETTRIQARIHGRVQGVGYRYFVKECADRTNLYGWVRNRFDGTVELIAEGDKSDLLYFINLLYKGPLHSNVSEVNVDWKSPTKEYTYFSIRRSV